MRNKDKEELSKLIFRIFLKHVKLHHMYPQFRCSVNVDNRYKDIVHIIVKRALDNYEMELRRLVTIGSTTKFAHSLNDIHSLIYNTLGNFDAANGSDAQMKLMHVVNNLVHSCIEYSVHENFKCLEIIGEEIFKEVCKNVLGEDFIDKTQDKPSFLKDEIIANLSKLPPRLNFSRDFDAFWEDGNLVDELKKVDNMVWQRWADDFARTEGIPNDWDTPF